MSRPVEVFLRIAFCTPFKPLNHPRISGDVTIARDLCRALEEHGHEIIVLPHYPSKWIYWHPGRWARAGLTLRDMIDVAEDAHCWLSYGSYYKVPDVFGPLGSSSLDIPYFLFQASHAPSRGRKLRTWPGYRLNRRAMLAADHVFCNRMNDMDGCSRLLPPTKYSYVRPGLANGMFRRDLEARERLRTTWKAGDEPVVLTAAMLRSGVKVEGVRWVIRACAGLMAKGLRLRLVIAGDGPRRGEIEALARTELPGRVIFTGMVDREAMPGLYSAADVFAFPGLEESVGMVYLEAQACGLPVVATDDEGAPQVVCHGTSGIITSTTRPEFTAGLERLLTDTELREKLASRAPDHVQREHDMTTNCRDMAALMAEICGRTGES
ncbi:glycosyltransferase family 4 protein [Pseudodesulfovibrio tunisiensis]|uniref:glycosyltransferase family 4 protein n=1 Tax=Pseudodesulfovibrio tunisiensis TaxID=463192 RepID=UPI001FB3FFBD|nr:glycosyltransferase family 4 protein [Pseudodesulfovibrio tunisiensis]